MTIDTEDLINSILDSFSRIDYIKPDEIPNIDLYMDQVTTFMEQHLATTKRCPEDKILTKTMINNYAKNHLLPPPEKKKYSKEHILILIFIYYFKGFLSIGDIQKILSPLAGQYFHTDSDLTFQQIYEEVFRLEKPEVEFLKEDVKRKYQTSLQTFGDVSEEEKHFLQIFSFICMLSFDVYIKTQLIQKLIDQL